MTTPRGSDVDWVAGAKMLGQRVALSQLEPSAIRELSKLAESSACVAVACSGGVDSLVTLLLVWTHFPQLRERLLVVGFNHQTRPECASEMHFVEAAALALGASFIGGVLETKSGPVETSEAALREQRLAFFSETMSARDCRVLVQGHQADDVAETMLMRLARGSGTAGLAAPRPVQWFADGRVFLRPLLSVKKSSLIAAVRLCGLPWCEDASNGGRDYLRNRMRHEVVPPWEQAQGAAVSQGVLRSRRLLDEDDAALEAWLAGLWPRIAGVGDLFRYDWRVLDTLPRALHRRALWRVLQVLPEGGALTAQAVDGVVDALAEGRAGRWSLGTSFLVFDGASLVFETREAVDRDGAIGIIFAGGKLFWPWGGMMEVTAVKMTEELLKTIMAGEFSPQEAVFLSQDSLAGRLYARTWQSGDAYQALGAPGSRKLSDMFIDKKIGAKERGELPVVCDDKGILWVPGLPPAERCRLQASFEKALQLTWSKAPLTFYVLENESASE